MVVSESARIVSRAENKNARIPGILGRERVTLCRGVSKHQVTVDGRKKVHPLGAQKRQESSENLDFAPGVSGGDFWKPSTGRTLTFNIFEKWFTLA